MRHPQGVSAIVSPRLFIVSNRLPVTLTPKAGALQVTRSTGGLATGLASVHSRPDAEWIGWAGDLTSVSPAAAAAAKADLAKDRLVHVDLEKDLVDDYYFGFANSILWPLFHYNVDRLPHELAGWSAYRTANERFADAVVDRYQASGAAAEGGTIWVHDYQLMLLPALLRQRLPEARIGFFLHIPFPSSEVFRILPWREEILRGMLGADLIGFHTHAYARHFATTLVRLLGIEDAMDRVRHEGRAVELDAFPMSVDVAAYAAPVKSPSFQGLVGSKVLLAVDRMDYTKGIPQRLLSFQRLLETNPDLAGRAVLVQIAVPSREPVAAYGQFRKQVHELVGRINGRFGGPGYQPVHFAMRAYGQKDLIRMYRQADAMVVTPLRDGMNLVAKEFVAARTDEDGVLILSEFAGAAAELGEALLVNPYDIDQQASAMRDALEMTQEERSERMRALRSRLSTYDVATWASHFLSRLDSVSRPQPTKVATTKHLLEAVDGAQSLCVLLDYDGTLVPYHRVPKLARPDAAMLDLLESLATNPTVHVHVLSGRGRETLEHWLGRLPIGMVAEHGAWARRSPDAEWTSIDPDGMTRAAATLDGWRPRVKQIIGQFIRETPGSTLEEKERSLVWHYRLADPVQGARKSHELRYQLRDALSNMPLEVTTGNKIVEVREMGADKGMAARRALAEMPPGTLAIAIGDDVTDEDMFRALPPDAITIKVGGDETQARFRLRDWREVRHFLANLAVRNNLVAGAEESDAIRHHRELPVQRARR
jgi:trehalose 6-phosphate synthase/phosphatase